MLSAFSLSRESWLNHLECSSLITDILIYILVDSPPSPPALCVLSLEPLFDLVGKMQTAILVVVPFAHFLLIWFFYFPGTPQISDMMMEYFFFHTFVIWFIFLRHICVLSLPSWIGSPLVDLTGLKCYILVFSNFSKSLWLLNLRA